MPQLHKAITRAGALLRGRRQSRSGGYRQIRAARLQLQARRRWLSLGHSRAKRSGAFCEDARPDAGFPQGAHSRTGWQAGYEKVRAFSAANPETLHQANYIAAHPPPESFAGTTYWGVHAFPATNAKGETRFIKFKIVPAGGEVTLTEDAVKAKSADFLYDDLESRITSGDVRFNVMALLDRPGDPTMDVTIRWPDEDSREAVRLGTIVITGVEANDACDASIFNPANLAEGIGHPPDEIFAARRDAYAISLAKRR